MPFWPKPPQEGDRLKAEWGRAVVEVLVQMVRPRPPLRFERNAKGVVLSLDDDASGFGAGIGITGGTITARSSMTAGQGTVSLLKFNPPTFASDRNVTAFNIKASTIPAGKWVVILKIYGHWFIVAIAC